MSFDDLKQVPILQAAHVAKNISHAAGVLQVLEDVNLTLFAGETAVIVGASGSGKSTLLSLLAGLDEASAGDIALFGKVLNRMDESARARLRQKDIGFVFQSFQLFPSLTALENVRLPLDLCGEKNAQARALEMLERVRLGARSHHLPRQLSGGEQQRVALARAFVSMPKLLFADEPTGNLDAVTGGQIIDLMFELNRAHQTTLVLVTHDSTLAERCQRAFHLAGGKLTELVS